MPRPGHIKRWVESAKDWASYNTRLVARYQDADLDTMIRLVRASHAELVAYLEQLTPEQLLTDQGVRHGNYKVIISRLIVAEEKDELKHLEQIRRFVAPSLVRCAAASGVEAECNAPEPKQVRCT